MTNIIDGDSGNNLLTGTAARDIINGFEGDDTLYGGGGNDTLRGDGGDDFLFGEAGNDVLFGGIGNDTLSGGAGEDTLYGQIGDDILIDGEGNDTLYGGSGNDRFVSNDMSFTNDPGHSGGDYLDGGDGVDTVDYRGRAEGVHIDSNAGLTDGHDFVVSSRQFSPSSVNLEDQLVSIERIIGSELSDDVAGNDRADDHFFDVGGVDIHSGGDSGNIITQTGVDTIDYSLLNTSVYANIDFDHRVAYEGYSASDFGVLDLPSLSTPFPNAERVIGFENINGSHFGDVLIGSSGLVSFRSGNAAGDPTEAYIAGHNVINGNGGDDIIYGGVGNDTIRGGDGDDFIIGYFDVIDDSGLTYGSLTSEHSVNDLDNDFLRGNDGNDHIEGRQGDDELRGDRGDDYLDGGLHNDILRGGIGRDTLIGGEGDDDLYGDDNPDRLIGGAGNDDLFGGGENDVFVFEDGFDLDIVRDFGFGNSDRLDVSGWSFINDFSDVQANITQSGSFVSIWDTANGDRLLLANTDVSEIDASDFIFA